MSRSPLGLACAVVVALAVPLTGAAQNEGAHGHDAAPAVRAGVKLGTIRFPTSAKGAAQADFIEGVLYLHSFEYESARDAFRRAQRKSPAFALAYWGDAQSWNHPVWNQRNADSARAALARLAPTAAERAARAPSAREKAWLNTVEVLYGDGPKPRRDSLYLRSMEALALAHPDDESRTFLALAWLGLNQGDRRVSDYMRAGAIAQRVLEHSPDHPGAAHFVIHAFDDPEHAVLGLDAARAYSGIAPGAAHAQHMTTHIFLALGMWPESNAQNRIAHAASNGRSGHYLQWLAYGLQQEGRFRDAAALLDSVRASIGRPGWRLGTALASVRAAYVVDRDDWTLARDPALLASNAEDRMSSLLDAWLYGMGAARRHDTTATGAALARARALDVAMRASGQTPPGDRLVAAALVQLVEGADAAQRGDTARALDHLRSAQASFDAAPVAFGPPTTPLLVGEYRAEVLLAAGRAAEAKAVLQDALRQNPGRSRSLALLVRAAMAAGDLQAADAARAQLARNWANADDGGARLRALALSGAP